MKNYFYLLLLLFVSCNDTQKNRKFEQYILGSWIEVVERDSILPPISNTLLGYDFFEEGKCNVLPGFLKYSKDYSEAEFYGTATKYKLDGDNIQIFDLTNGKWTSFRVNKLSSDSLEITNEKYGNKTFVKRVYPERNNDDFDEIVFSASPCYGSCPVNSIYINKTGEVSYLGDYFNKDNGYYSAKIYPEKFNEIENRFKKADFLNLKNSYSNPVTDLSETSIVFVKHGKIIKSITDYGAYGPDELVWAYNPLVYISQQLKLTSRDTTNYFGLSYLEAKRSKDILKFSEAESYYLSILLEKGKYTDKIIDKIYMLTSINSDISIIYTDGQIYTIYYKNGTAKTIDIGYNFLEENEFAFKFEKI